MRGATTLAAAAVILGAAAAIAGEGTAAPRPQLLENARYWPPAPKARGKEYRPPASPGYIERHPVIWIWRLELPDGRGLTFGGLSIRTDDPRPPTPVKRGGAWVPIREELRRKNPLQ